MLDPEYYPRKPKTAKSKEGKIVNSAIEVLESQGIVDFSSNPDKEKAFRSTYRGQVTKILREF